MKQKTIGIYAMKILTTDGEKIIDFGQAIQFKKVPKVIIKDGEKIKVVEFKIN